MTEREGRQAVVEFGRSRSERGCSHGSSGNPSGQLPEPGGYLISPQMSHSDASPLRRSVNLRTPGVTSAVMRVPRRPGLHQATKPPLPPVV